MKSFRDKVAAITGAGSGIGRSLAQALAAEGCHLALSDLNGESLGETVDLVADRFPQVAVTTAVLDVADRAAVEAWADQVVAEHGAVNLVINNAGVALGTTLEAVSYADFEWIMGINFWGVVYGTKAFLPHLRASGDGHVVNMSSVFGLFSQPSQGTYNSSKFAVRGFTEALRQELEFSRAPVSATCVHPGGIRTNIARAARFNDSVLEMYGGDVANGRTRVERMLLTSAERAAKEILNAVRKNRRRVLVGPDAKLFDAVVRLLPTGYQRIVTGVVRMGSRS